MAEQPQLPGAQWFKGDFRRPEHIAGFAKAYTEGRGLTYRHGPDELASVRANPDEIADLGRTVQKQAGTSQAMDPTQAASYRSYREDVEDQYSYMTRPEVEGGLGVNVEVSRDDPYPTPQAMRDDYEQNNRLKVYSSANTPTYNNLAMPTDVNDKLRAVHDYFGHLGTGRNFSRHGENAAFEHHAQMFRPESRYALTSELKSQNAGLYWTGEFPENRPYRLSEEQVNRSVFTENRGPKPRQQDPGQGRLPL